MPQLLTQQRLADGGRESSNNKGLTSDDRLGESGNADDGEHSDDHKQDAATGYEDFPEDDGREGEESKKNK